MDPGPDDFVMLVVREDRVPETRAFRNTRRHGVFPLEIKPTNNEAAELAVALGASDGAFERSKLRYNWVCVLAPEGDLWKARAIAVLDEALPWLITERMLLYCPPPYDPRYATSATRDLD